MAIGVIVVGGQLMGRGRVGPTEARQGGGPKEEVDLNGGLAALFHPPMISAALRRR